MQIKQFEDTSLAHYSYAILSDCEKKIVLIDPARNPKQYLAYAKENDAQITGIIETHPHADFVSSHLELSIITGATIYTSALVKALYPHQSFDERQSIQLGKIKLSALNTPGHSPDSISIVLEHEGRQKIVFTGDTLFIGDCGRPDLRESVGNIQASRNDLAKQMYHSLRNKLIPLEDTVIVYPAHGAGTLCGKALSKANSSTMGEEKKTNWCLQPQTEEAFVNELLSEQPFIPAYFSYDVTVNRNGAPPFETSIQSIPWSSPIDKETTADRLQKDLWIIDTRPESEYKKGHLPQSINLMRGNKFETWLGSMIKPGEPFYLAGDNETGLQEVIERIAAIGYESQITETFILHNGNLTQEQIDVPFFTNHMAGYTIIDVRNSNEVKEKKIFDSSISLPLGELRNNLAKIPLNKPIVVHCAGGYRSAAASSLIQSSLNGKVKVFDLGEAVNNF